ncbi:hypothetical protein CORC01_12228, partial [Colletotrichum orchidophilum]
APCATTWLITLAPLLFSQSTALLSYQISFQGESLTRLTLAVNCQWLKYFWSLQRGNRRGRDRQAGTLYGLEEENKKKRETSSIPRALRQVDTSILGSLTALAGPPYKI